MSVVIAAVLCSSAAQAQANSPYGVNLAFWSNISDADTQALSANAAEAGFGWIRLFILWSDVEPNAPIPNTAGGLRTFNWNPNPPGTPPGSRNYQAQIDNAVNAGLKVHLSLVGPPPCWAISGGCQVPTPGSKPMFAWQFGGFAEAVAQQFQGKISSWGLWHEVNDPNQWATPDGGLSNYDYGGYKTLILIPGYDAIRSVSPLTLISAPGVVGWPTRVIPIQIFTRNGSAT